MRINSKLLSKSPKLNLFIFLCLGVLPSSILQSQSLYGVDEKVVEASVISHFLTDVPNRGFMTLDLRIKNNLSSSETWTFDFESRMGWNRKKLLLSRRSVQVDAKSAKTVRWEIPVFPSTELRHAPNQRLTVSVSGPGAASGSRQELFNSSFGHSPGSPSRALVAVSPFFGANRDQWNFNDFQKRSGNNKAKLLITRFDEEAIPGSLMGFSGVDILLMSEKEWEEISMDHPVVVRWLATGGQVVLLGERDGESRSIGAGFLHRFALSDESRIFKRLSGLETFTSEISDEDAFTRRDWELAEAIPEIKNSFGRMMLVVLFIAALLGPLNIWLSFRRKNTLQVIWTTPFISLVLSVLIIFGILFSDGLGGKGHRAQWVMLFYDQGIEITLQEQVSRTGVLIKNRFALPGDTEIYQVPGEINRSSRKIVYEQLANGDWTGDWFENRSIQAQVLRRVRTSRSDVRVLPGPEPEVISSVDATFSRIFIRDRDGGMWIAEKVSPGKKVKLRSAIPDEINALREDLPTRKEFVMNGRNVLEREGWFYAESLEDERYIDTVSAIRWRDRPIWYMGPVKGEFRP